MGKLLIKQKVFSIRDKFNVFDENENVKYKVESSLFSLKYKLTVYDQYDNEMGVITQRFFSFMPKFDVEIKGQNVGTIRKKFKMFSNNYDIDYNGWRVEGNFLGWNYNVVNGFNVVARIDKEIFHWGDTYVINYSNEEDELNALLLVLAIDAANRADSAAASAASN